jgi:hypothetical protein
MRKWFTIAAAAGFMAFGAPAFAQGAGNPAVGGSLSVAPPGAANPYAQGPYRPYAAARPRWRRDYWGSPHEDSLPRYAQYTHDYHWPGPQDGANFGPGPL